MKKKDRARHPRSQHVLSFFYSKMIEKLKRRGWQNPGLLTELERPLERV